MVARYWENMGRALLPEEWKAGADADDYDPERDIRERDGVFLWTIINKPRHYYAGFKPLSEMDLASIKSAQRKLTFGMSSLP
jgi:hypothetical protein